MSKIYDVLNIECEQVGDVSILESEMKLKITNKGFEIVVDNILDVFEYTKANKLHLADMQGDFYSLAIHNEVVKNINRLGIGYIVR